MVLKAAYIVAHPPLAVPEVGRGEERGIADTIGAYREVARRVAAHRPDTVLFISPHTAYYGDWIYLAGGQRAHGSFAEFGAPGISFSLQYDTGFRDALDGAAASAGVRAGCVTDKARELDHGVLVPLYFIAQELPPSSYRALCIGGSGLPAEELLAFGRCLARVAAEREGAAVLVVSGDLSHKLKADGPYGFDPAGPLFDAAFGEVVRSGKPLGFAGLDPKTCRDAAECGLSGFIMLAGALDETERLGKGPFSSELLSLEGPFGVGYGMAAFEGGQGEGGQGYV
ncbi:MAG: hypothetical protein FWG23_03955 [Eggerthellaceae bacterium]|jgi:aromatic ring-opening dioxygenase LigB subunit|nr:hypothetical protein [Eggerthellaceae bacterium]MDR2715887.1 hypothetical protein [Coriobacteriaceae bacterium]